MKSYDVFISHANEDVDWCEQLAKHLNHHGLQALLEKWQMPREKWQVAETDQNNDLILSTSKTDDDDDDLINIIERGLARSSRVILLLTPNYLNEKRNWSEAERHFMAYQTLTGYREFAIPLLLKDCKLPPFLREFQCLDFRDPTMYQFNLDKLIVKLKDAPIDTYTTLPLTMQGAVNHKSRDQKRIVTIGGTFDTLHKGHKEYIRLAFQFADRVLIYMTSDEHGNDKKEYPVRPYDFREKRLSAFIQEIKCENRCEIRCLHKLEEVEFDYLENSELKNKIYMAVVPPEYYDFFLKLNFAREARGIQPFLILVKLRKRDSQKGDFSSSMIRYHGAEK